jgi:hypothetical protein
MFIVHIWLYYKVPYKNFENYRFVFGTIGESFIFTIWLITWPNHFVFFFLMMCAK